MLNRKIMIKSEIKAKATCIIELKNQRQQHCQKTQMRIISIRIHLENASPKKGCGFNSTNNSNVDEDTIPSKSFSFEEEDDERVDDDDERRANLITSANNSINNNNLKASCPRPAKRSTLLPRTSNKNNINRHHRTNSNTVSSDFAPQLTARMSPNPFLSCFDAMHRHERGNNDNNTIITN